MNPEQSINSPSVLKDSQFSWRWFLGTCALVIAVYLLGEGWAFVQMLNRNQRQYEMLEMYAQPGKNVDSLLQQENMLLLDYTLEEWKESILDQPLYEPAPTGAERVYVFDSMGLYRYLFVDAEGEILAAYRIED